MSNTDAAKHHVSELSDPRQRFLARVLGHSTKDGWRTPVDFLRHFPPGTIVESLAGVDALRVALLVATTGTHEKIALKKSVGSATEDLELSLSEGTTTPAALFELYPTDDKVRHLPAGQLWQFATEDEFYKVTAAEDAARHARASGRMTFILECALEEGLITLKDLADGITFEEISGSLPEADVRELVKYALEIGRAGAPLAEERLLAVVPLGSLVSHVPLEHVWQRVVLERVAAPAGFAGRPAPAAKAAAESPSSVDVPRTEPALPPELPAEASAVPAAGPPPLPGPADDDEIRRKLIERLRVIDRLPPGFLDIGTPILLSVESMYADLWTLTDDEEREACIRESFPNDAHLRSAMLSLIELLDPSVDTHDPIIRDADVTGLMKIVLFEERRRRDAAPARRTQQGASAARSPRSVPPPLPRSSTPPPPLPAVVPPVPSDASASRRDR